MRVAVIGGGAAGFFAAISCKTHHPKAEVVIYEKGSKLLSKVKVSGGGRCNVTHQCFDNKKLAAHYPRGEKFLRNAFSQFAVEDAIDWFESNRVVLKAENDGRMFPVTDDSQTIINALMTKARQLGIVLNLKQQAAQLLVKQGGLDIISHEGIEFSYNKVIVASGGSPKIEGLQWLEVLGHAISPPVPSLFTFNMPNEPVKALMGVAVERATIKVQGTKLKQSGPLLITHWGMSGPAILKTSAWGARELSDLGYKFKIQVNWVDDKSENDLRLMINEMQENHHKRMVANKNAFGIPSRLWEFLMTKIGLRADIIWGEIGQKGVNKLVNVLLNDVYQVEGKTTFKEEFVTCGGVALSDINNETMESKRVPGLYFAGEVMDIDGITGGFNFQVAWTTGWIAGKLT
ncbi:NAD(P)/FAD-dependent oxidoreductase [Fulvivirga sp.]|uniref:NAD(P)/FAD-dependent oxidoreductase n=3 Tax=Fulvivirga sp. TaxID=1931237 RepID=UPI0032EC18E4